VNLGRQGIERLIPHAEAECVELMQKLLRHGISMHIADLGMGLRWFEKCRAQQKGVCLNMYPTKTSISSTIYI